jgi:ribonuclease-3
MDKQALQTVIGYSFKQQALLDLALTHSSCAGEDNERLEFLGDAIVNCIVAQALYEKFPQGDEGDLSRLRAAMVRGDALAEIGASFELGQAMSFGAGELKTGGRTRPSILACAIEALIGAIFLDSDYNACSAVVAHWYDEKFRGLSLDPRQYMDAKTRLQEHLQARHQDLPVYEMVNVETKGHDRTFIVRCSVVDVKEPLLGVGPTRRKAEQNAAAKVLARYDDGQ